LKIEIGQRLAKATALAESQRAAQGQWCRDQLAGQVRRRQVRLL
jgi:hypothetical protein